MREGSLEAPTRHPVAWEDPEFTDPQALDEELRRVFDVCHGCRRCFNLCDSFPRLFDLIDESATGELDSVDSKDFKPVEEACTLCDMCFMTKCPYVPPHEFNIDFPHLMLRYRYANRQQEKNFIEDQLVEMDRNGNILTKIAPIANWGASVDNVLTRPLLEKTLGIHRKAAVPKFAGETLTRRVQKEPLSVNKSAPAYGRKAVVFATCFCNYNNTDLGLSALGVLNKLGVETEVVYPGCCGMPQLEQGNIEKVVKSAHETAALLKPWVDKGYDIIAPVPSCALMLKLEWPLLTQDENVHFIAKQTWDISQYIVDIARNEGLPGDLISLGNVTLHLACHARAQNMGQKAAEMLRLIPETTVNVIERCSGHGGSWGMMVDHFDVAMKIGKPAAQQAIKAGNNLVASECPLAAEHLMQGIESLSDVEFTSLHPIQIFERALKI